MLEIFKYMDNAITLKPISDLAFDYGKSQFQKANSTLTDEGMYDMGVQDSSIVKSLGLFGLVFSLLIFLISVYYATICIKNKSGLAHKLRIKLE